MTDQSNEQFQDMYIDTYDNGLCTVPPTIFKKCKNDWISINGTCYEDSCCTSFETATAWYYRLAQLSHVVFSAIGIFVIFLYVGKHIEKHMLPFNIRVFVNIILIVILIHSMDMILIHVYHLFQSFQAVESDPCFVRVRVDFCAPFRYTYSFCALFLTILQYSIYIDRIFCIYWRKYTQYHKTILFVLLVQMIVIGVSLIAWVYREENPKAYLLSCLNIPLDSMIDLSLVTACIFPINIVCLVLSHLLFRAFKEKQKGSRFDVSLHFTAVLDVQSSEFLFHTTACQAVFIVMYPVLAVTMRLLYEAFPRPIHLTFATMIYVFSIYSAVVPTVMLNCVRSTKQNRKEQIWSQVNIKSIGIEGADNYFNSLKSQWN